jgi:hypothetical protein
MPTIATMMITSGASENSVQNASAPECSNASRSSQRCAAALNTRMNGIRGMTREHGRRRGLANTDKAADYRVKH